jgi:transposase-like protein
MHTSIVEAPAGRRRRRHSAEFKASVIQAAQQPGVSMAAVALANGLNATMLRKWVTQSQLRELPQQVVPATPESHVAQPQSLGFLPVALAAARAESMPAADIRIDLQRAGTTLKISWPSSAAADCATWLRELLR